MAVGNLAINGLGSFGRAALKILFDTDGLDVVAVNDLSAGQLGVSAQVRHCLRGGYERQVEANRNALTIDERSIPVFAEKDPAALPWSDLSVDLVLECTGVFREERDLRKHIDAGRGS